MHASLPIFKPLGRPPRFLAFWLENAVWYSSASMAHKRGMNESSPAEPFTEEQIEWDEAVVFLKRLLQKRLGASAPSDIDDLAQEAAIDFLRALRRTGAEKPKALMTTIANRAAIDFIDRRRRWSILVTPLGDNEPNIPGKGNDPSVFGDMEQRVQFIVLEYFRQQESQCLELAKAFFDEHDWETVAKTKRLKTAAIRKRWSRCVDRLRKEARTHPDLMVLGEWARGEQ